MPSSHGLGRRYAPDVRDRGYLLAAPPPTQKIPAYRMWQTGVRLDQGQTPQCVGYSCALLVRAGPIVNPLPDPSKIYALAQTLDEFPDTPPADGTSVRAGFKALQKMGILSAYHWAPNISTAMNFVLSTGPMVFGTNWYDSMFDPDKHGYLNIDPKAQVAGGHAWLVCGAENGRTNPDGSKGAARMQNSWGRSWGDNGRAWISYDTLSRLIKEDGEAGMGIEIKEAAKAAA